MNAAASTRLARWWGHGGAAAGGAQPPGRDALDRTIALGATYEPFMAAVAARAWHWSVRQAKRLTAPREPRTPQELLAYARSIERTMPSQAAELRFMVMHQADTID